MEMSSAKSQNWAEQRIEKFKFSINVFVDEKYAKKLTLSQQKYGGYFGFFLYLMKISSPNDLKEWMTNIYSQSSRRS